MRSRYCFPPSWNLMGVGIPASVALHSLLDSAAREYRPPVSHSLHRRRSTDRVLHCCGARELSGPTGQAETHIQWGHESDQAALVYEKEPKCSPCEAISDLTEAAAHPADGLYALVHLIRSGRGRAKRQYCKVLLIGALLCAATASAQNPITTIAGGGTNSTTATAAVIIQPPSVAVDGSGNVFFISQMLNQVFKVNSAGDLVVVAGSGAWGFSGDGGPATNAALNFVSQGFLSGIALDSLGSVVFADSGNNRIRRVDAATGIITTVAGNGTAGFGGDGGPAISASLNSPAGIAIDNLGDLYIADSVNNRIRKVDGATGIINTVAGTSPIGFGSGSFSGDGGPAISATFSWPSGLAADAFGNLFIADTINVRVRRVDAATGIVTTVAGGGLGGDGGPATSASLVGPFGVAIDMSGDLFIADALDNRLRRVDGATGIITTVAGSGSVGYSGDGGPATSASFNSPSGVAVDGLGNLFIADLNNQRIRYVSVTSGTVTTLAGGGTGGDGGYASEAFLLWPEGVTVDAQGDVFIAEPFTQRIRKVVAATGIITTVAGNGTAGFSGDGGPATSASMTYPYGVAADTSGNLLIADWGNVRVRRLDAETGIIETVAGNGAGGFSGDGGPAVWASLLSPIAVSSDDAGNYFIAEDYNQRIRKVDSATGIITTVAGTGTAGFSGDGGAAISASFNNPRGVAVDGSGNFFIADWGNFRIRRVDAATGIITTVAGNGTAGFGGDGGAATNASIGHSYGVAVDAAGNLYIADADNNRIRRVDMNTGIITTFAGNGTYGFSGDGGPATNASLAVPTGVAVDSSGNVLIADAGNHRIRKVAVSPVANLSTTTLTFGSVPVGQPSDALPVTVTNSGYGVLHVSSVSITGSNPSDFSKESDSCTGAAVASGSSCSISVTFTPALSGTRTGTLTILDDSNGVAGSTQTVSLTGTGISSGGGLPVVKLSSSDLYFGNPVVGTTAGTQTVTLKNEGTGTLTISSSITPSTARFGATSTCGSSVAAGTSCTISVTFTPIAAGTVTGSIVISDNAEDSPHEITLTGIGMNPYYQFEGLPNVPSPSYDTSGECLTQKYGCALTASGSVLTTFNSSITPYSLDQFLTPGGYDSDCGLLFKTIPPFPALGGAVQLVSSLDIEGQPAKDYLSEHLLGLRQRVILQLCEVASDGSCKKDSQGNRLTHFIVATSPIGTEDWQVFDPGYNPTTLSGHLESFTSSNGALHKFKVIGVRTFEPSTNPTAFSAQAHSPVELVVTDPQGRRTGNYNGADAFEIPLASYFRDYPLEDDSGTGPAIGDPSGIKTAYIPYPLDGTYTVQLTGTGAGMFSVEFSAVANDGSTQQTSVSGTTAPGSTSTYDVPYSSAPGAPVTVTREPSGPSAGLSVGGLNFGSQLLGSTSGSQSVTLSNNGDSAMAITGMVVSGDFTQTNTCGTSVAAGATCIISGKFVPASTGARTGTITITSNASGSPHSVALFGTGTDFAVTTSSGSSDLATVNAGDTATYNLQLAPTGFSGDLAVACSWQGTQPRGTNCSVSPGQVSLDGINPGIFTVSVTTTKRSLVLPRAPALPPGFGRQTIKVVLLLGLLGLFLLVAVGRRQEEYKKAWLVACGAMLLCVALWTTCGGEGASPSPPPQTGTPAGTYKLTVTGTTSGISRSVTLTLKVN